MLEESRGGVGRVEWRRTGCQWSPGGRTLGVQASSMDGRGGQGGGGEGEGMARCDSGSVAGRGLTSLLDGVKFMFFLWK